MVDLYVDKAESCMKYAVSISLLVLMLIYGNPVLAGPDTTYPVNIESSSLSEALNELARQTGKVLVAPTEILPDTSVVSLQGHFTLAEALSRLLHQSDVEPRLRDNMILLVRSPEPQTPLPIEAPTATAANQSELMDTIIVRGYRDSLSASQMRKRSNVLGSDTIFAEDIADFPELNLGDALQRLPGMIAERDNGETRQLGLRGLGPNFVRVQINHVESLATFNSIFDHRGSASRSRNFDFNIFAAELFRQIDVEKTYTAKQDEGGIAGTINLITPRPFDFDQSQAAVSIKQAYNEQSNAFTPRFSALFSASGEQAGGLLSVAYSETNTFESGHRDWGWRTFSRSASGPDLSLPQKAALADGRLVGPTVASYTFARREQRRLGLTTSLQWSVSEALQLSFDNLYASLDSTDHEYNLANQNMQGVTALDYDRHNTVQFARFEQADIRSEAKYSEVQTEFWSSIVDLSYRINKDVSLHLSGSQTRSDFFSPVHDKIFLQAPGRAFGFDYREHQRAPARQYDFDLADRQHWQLHRADVREDQIRNRFLSLNADLTWHLDAQYSVEFGGQYKGFISQGFERRDDVRDLNELGLGYVTAPVNMPSHPDFVVADVNKSFAGILEQGLQGRISRQPFDRTLGAESNRLGTAFELEEETFGLYAQLNIEINDLRGNLGLRWLDTRFSSSGESLITSESSSSGDNLTLTPLSFASGYQQWLPSLNLAWDVSDNLTLRFSASRNLSRPGISDLRATADVSIPDNRVDQGNPELRPFVARSLDFGAEIYFGQVDFVGLSLYYKDLDSYIVNQTRLVDFDQLNLPVSLLTEDRKGQLFSLSQPFNGDGGVIRGAELSSRFEFVPGVGMLANYTFAQGKTQYGINGRQIDGPLLYLSKHTYNLTLYLEYARGGVRISTTFRDRYFTEVDNINDFHGVNALQFVDASLFFKLSENVKLTLDALNLSDEDIDVFADPEANRPLVNTRSGRRWQLGLSLAF
ncbi:TonB-dependent receptor [Lacimicrobium alkaliphilum]|uniref:TonB-dependent receptor n=1 Tax=Lacimicrobium alkaliphilum TaxID=1526571 RepID=A0ABQ1RG70_9ALTE|nr:TonB-dependent receptor [Lacimicrobium alkaliphilum]GGD69432.1 TonB-dependent receptor [Lacimicrobium alkaliphilum]